MTNKEKLKEIIEKDINPNEYYQNIITKITGNDKKTLQFNYWKLAFTPLVLTLISGLFYLNYQNNIKSFLENNLNINDNININEIDKIENTLKIDAKIKQVTDISDDQITKDNENFLIPYKEDLINIPSDLDEIYKYIYYFKENYTDYTLLGNYEIIHTNHNNRTIDIKYAKDHKPVRDYYFDENDSKISSINNMDLRIYKYEKLYFTEFKYNDYYFDIETSNIKENELKSFLQSFLRN